MTKQYVYRRTNEDLGSSLSAFELVEDVYVLTEEELLKLITDTWKACRDRILVDKNLPDYYDYIESILQ